MSIFFPIINSSNIVTSSINIYNFPPNNLYPVKNIQRYVYLIWIENNFWKTKWIKTLKPNENLEINEHEFKNILPTDNSLPVITLSENKLENKLNKLPIKTLPQSSPQWRATITIHRNDFSSSYQGEIKPFPSKATLISFSPFIQNDRNVKNYMFLLNLESSPVIREDELTITKASNPQDSILSCKILSNSSNLIDLNDIKITNTDLLICYARNMSGIPLFVSFSDTDKLLSIEHTHPPTSLIIGGNRFKGQSSIKRNWFNYLK
tara:strand:+ start:568 stop:1359 length:792 start_codon:yes stop_codon:yes gene_type:complete